MTPKKGADGRWHAWVTVGTKTNGRPDQRHVSRATRDEAKVEVDRLLERKATSTVVKSGKKPTLAAWLDTYLSTVAPRRCDPTTVRDYRSKMDLYVIPEIGKTRIDKVTGEQLDAVYLAMDRKLLAPSTVLKTHRVLSRALEVALRRKLVGVNVAKLIDAPSGKNRKVPAMPVDAARGVLDGAEQMRNRSRWAVALSLGLRQGEALGLRWEFVDFDVGEIRVEWQLHRRSFEHGCGGSCGRKRGGNCPQRDLPLRHGEIVVSGGLILKPPKGTGTRTVPLSPELVKALERQREVQNMERSMAGGAWQRHGFVWARLDGSAIDPADDYQEWKALAAAAGAPAARLHDARHFAATFLRALGVAVEAVQELLGHADIRTTRGYTHVASEMLREAARSSGAALLGRGGTP